MRPTSIEALSLLAFSLLFLSAKLWLIQTYASPVPFWDQWDGEALDLYKPFLEGTLDPVRLLAPHNEHRIFTTRLLALALLQLNGLWNPLLQMVVNALIHLMTVLTMLLMMTQVIGRRRLIAMLPCALWVYALPYAYENTLAGFQGQFYLVVFFSLATMWCFNRSTESRGSTVANAVMLFSAAGLAFLSLASGVFSVLACLGIGALQALQGRRSPRHLVTLLGLAVVAVLAIKLTPVIAGHQQFRASSVGHFLNSFAQLSSWPLNTTVVNALFRNAPAIGLLGWLSFTRPPHGDRHWFLGTLALWALAQGAATAFGRADSCLAPRYLDLYAASVMVNLACLLALALKASTTRRRWATAVVVLWVVLVAGAMGRFSYKFSRGYLDEWRDFNREQLINTRGYLSTGDFSFLKDKPELHIPFPDAQVLKGILDDPTVRSILPGVLMPAEVSSPSREGRFNHFVNELTSRWHWLLAFGLLLGSIAMTLELRRAINQSQPG